jgi:hypothetical protein
VDCTARTRRGTRDHARTLGGDGAVPHRPVVPVEPQPRVPPHLVPAACGVGQRSSRPRPRTIAGSWRSAAPPHMRCRVWARPRMADSLRTWAQSRPRAEAPAGVSPCHTHRATSPP